LRPWRGAGDGSGSTETESARKPRGRSQEDREKTRSCRRCDVVIGSDEAARRREAAWAHGGPGTGTRTASADKTGTCRSSGDRHGRVGCVNKNDKGEWRENVKYQRRFCGGDAWGTGARSASASGTRTRRTHGGSSAWARGACGQERRGRVERERGESAATLQHGRVGRVGMNGMIECNEKMGNPRRLFRMGAWGHERRQGRVERERGEPAAALRHGREGDLGSAAS
jgi:hypothetical protein